MCCCDEILLEQKEINSVTTLILPTQLHRIGDSAFAGTATQYVLIPEGVKEIGSRAFAGAQNLSFVHIPATVTMISDEAFTDAHPVTFIGALSKEAQDYAEEHRIPVLPETP